MKPNIQKRLLRYLFIIRTAKDITVLQDEFLFFVGVVNEMQRIEYISNDEYERVMELATNAHARRYGFLLYNRKDYFLNTIK